MNGPVDEGGSARPRKGLSFAQEFATPTAVVAVWVGLLGVLIAAVSYVLPTPGWIRVLNVPQRLQLLHAVSMTAGARSVLLVHRAFISTSG